MNERKGYTLSDLQRMREELEISRRLDRIAHEHRMRQLLGDDVYRFMRGDVPEERRTDDRMSAMTARTARLTGKWSDGGLVQVADADGNVKSILLEGRPVREIHRDQNFSGSITFRVNFIDGTMVDYPDGTVELPGE